jgi:hypothetical protein
MSRFCGLDYHTEVQASRNYVNGNAHQVSPRRPGMCPHPPYCFMRDHIIYRVWEKEAFPEKPGRPPEPQR